MTREPVVIPDLVCGEVTRKLTDREEADPDFVIVRSMANPSSTWSMSLMIWRWESPT